MLLHRRHRRMIITIMIMITIIIIVIAGGVACSSADDTARVLQSTSGSRAGFEPVSRVLEARCGMLDCHGSLYRNFRLYGEGGLRLIDGDAIAPDQGPTRANEVDANHQAVTALEPETMRRVLQERGAFPERLTLIRKARNEEVHKGSDPIRPGDNADRCILSWLRSNVDAAACTAATP